MIPLCLVTGFLGSGKTTLLKRIIAQHRDEKIVYLINEFSTADVDGEVISGEQADTVSIPGGSIFCRCKVGEFISHLGATIPEQYDTEDEPVQAVVVETTGIADPGVALKMMAETGLDEKYEITGIVTVIDPHKFSRLVHTLPNVVNQVRQADWILVNKCDVFDEDQIATTEREVRRLNPNAEVHLTTYCDVELDLFSPRDHTNLDGEYAKCVDPNYAASRVELIPPVDLERISTALRELGEDLYRAKGFVQTAEGMRYVDWSAGRLEVQDTIVGHAPSELALIVRGQAKERLAEFERRVRG